MYIGIDKQLYYSAAHRGGTFASLHYTPVGVQTIYNVTYEHNSGNPIFIQLNEYFLSTIQSPLPETLIDKHKFD